MHAARWSVRSSWTLVEQALLVELKTAKALDERIAPSASIISRQPACGSACCSTSESHAWRSSAWPTACDRFRCICVHPCASPEICVKKQLRKFLLVQFFNSLNHVLAEDAIDEGLQFGVVAGQDVRLVVLDPLGSAHWREREGDIGQDVENDPLSVALMIRAISASGSGPKPRAARSFSTRYVITGSPGPICLAWYVQLAAPAPWYHASG